MSRRAPRTATRAERRMREWLVRAAVWVFIIIFTISAVGAIFVLPLLTRH